MAVEQVDASWITNIVVIDDDHISAVSLEMLLKQEGFRPHRAGNGPQGRALAEAVQPDLILLDIEMPGENGLDTCRKLKANPSTASIPIIFLTGSEDLSTKLDGFKVGAVDYITKPYHSSEVLARIRVHIGSHRMMRLLATSQMAQLDRLERAMKTILVDPSALPEARFAVYYKPVHSVGGDFYEVLQAGNQVFDYVVADVSGHDADASLVSSALKVLLHQGQSTLSSPPETLRMVNGSLRSTFPDHVYLTLVWLRLNRNRRVMSAWLAGHPPMMRLPSPAQIPELVEATGDVLGVFDNFEVEEVQIPVTPGDRIFLFTDGLIELPFRGESPSRERGLEELSRAVRQTQDLPLQDQVRAIADDLVKKASSVADDTLLLGVEV